MGSAAPSLRVLAGHAGPVNLIPVGCAGDAGFVGGEVGMGGRTEALDQCEVKGHSLRAACAFARSRIIVEILGAAVTGVGCIVPKSRQIAGFALLDCIVPSLGQVTSHTEVVSCQMRRIRGTHAELRLQIIVKSFGAGHAGQLVGIPNSRTGAEHAKLVEVHIRGVAWADARCVIRIEDISRRTCHTTLLSSVPVARLIAGHALPLRIYVRCSHRANTALCLHDHLISLWTSYALLESGIVPRVGRAGLALKINFVPEVWRSAFHALLLLGEEVPLRRALAGHCSHVEDIGFRAASLIDLL